MDDVQNIWAYTHDILPDIPRYDLHVSVFCCEGLAYLLRRTRNNRSGGSGIQGGKILRTVMCAERLNGPHIA